MAITHGVSTAVTLVSFYVHFSVIVQSRPRFIRPIRRRSHAAPRFITLADPGLRGVGGGVGGEHAPCSCSHPPPPFPGAPSSQLFYFVPYIQRLD
eukprot:jgi/Botrbrau1/13389/Bobra.0194s0020.1